MELLSSASGILLALVGIGFVIFIHELGHFLAAKWGGVRVDTFSIGFGPIIWSKNIGETEFALSLLPFGGYVAVRHQADGSGRTFEESSPLWRAIYLAAGVVFNAVSSFIILLCLAWYGMPMMPATVGGVLPDRIDQNNEIHTSPAYDLGLRTGDKILRYNDREPRGLEDIIAFVIEDAKKPIRLEVLRDGQRMVLPREGEEPVTPGYDLRQGRSTLGIEPARSRRITSVTGTKADLAGWQVVAINGEDVSHLIGQELDTRLRRHLGQAVTLDLQQDGETRQETLTYAGSSSFDMNASALGFPVSVVAIEPGLPAEEIGIQVGDVLASVDGVAVSSASHLSALVQARAESLFRLTWMTPGADGWEERSAEIQTQFDESTGRQLIGIGMATRNGGVLPVLPTALGKDTSPLAEAGLQPGDAVVAMAEANAETAERQLDVYFVTDGQASLIQLGPEATSPLLAPYDPPLLAKFVGAKRKPSLMNRMLGKRVLAAGAGGGSLLQLEDPTKNGEDRFVTLDLSPLPDPEERSLLAQLQLDDWIVARDFRVEHEDGLAIQLIRGSGADALQQVTVQPADIGVALAFNQIYEPTYELEAWTDAFGLATETSIGMLTITFKIIPKFFRPPEQGGVDASKSLAGPIGIFSELKARADHGLPSFLKLLALLGLNLVIVNLLPIPVADGGQLLMLLVEVVIRRPVPPRLALVINTCGMVFIIALMLFVVGVDVLRRMGQH